MMFSTLPKRCSKKSMLEKASLLCVGLLCLHGAQAQDINYVNANFSVMYNNQLTQGENRLNIQRNDTTYEIDFVLDHWMLSASQKAIFKMEQCQVQPISYTAVNKRPFKSDTAQRIEFDWSQN